MSEDFPVLKNNHTMEIIYGAKLEPISSEEMEATIREVCSSLAEFLISKQRAYGNSATHPINALSNLGAMHRMDVRIDDKLSRIHRGEEYPGDDTLLDLAGYSILKLVFIYLCNINNGANIAD